MHLICNLTEFVDYPKSIFFIYHNFAHNLGRTEISSKEDLVQKERKLQIDNPDKTVNIWAERITLTSNFNKELDLFKIGDFDNNYYASDGLKKQINLANITGCSFEPALNLIV
jgi:hypothetical protein